MRVLVVDDEVVSREKMKKIMSGLAECDEASSGKAALDAVSRALAEGRPYDLILLDISMPEMDGIDALKRIRHMEREHGGDSSSPCKIFMVTGSSDKQVVVSCIKAGCNDYITKPFGPDTVLAKLKENGFACSESDTGNGAGKDKTAPDKAAGMLDDIVVRFNKGEIELPAFPLVQKKFYELMKAGASLADIAHLLRQEPAIASKLIRISNSPFYRGFADNVTVEQAINRLGLIATKQTVDAIASRSLFDDAHPHYAEVVERLWEHSLSCAHACYVITELKRMKLDADPFTLGLLHDIGKLMLLRVVGELEKSGKKRVDGDVDALFASIDAQHGKTGAVLLKKWNFPAVFVQVADAHDDVKRVNKPSPALLVTHIANVTVKSMGMGSPNPPGVEPESLETLDAVGLNPAMIQVVKDQVQVRVNELKDYLR